MKDNKVDGKRNNYSSIPPWTYIIGFSQKYRYIVLPGVIFGVCLYSLMMSQQLTNTFDGLWHQNYHKSGTLELSSGRWMLYFLDKIVMGLHAEPLASFAALVLFIVGFLFVLDLFSVENNLFGCLSLMLFISSTTVSNTLSYRFTSFGYGASYLFAVLSVYAALKIKNKVAAVLVSGIFLGASLACYQAYLAVFCIIALFYILFVCRQSARGENVIRKVVGRLGCATLTGVFIYVVSLLLMLRLFHVSLSDYNGIGETSFGEFLTGLPQNILNSYKAFYAYFFLDALKINRLQAFGVFYLLLVIFGALTIAIGINTWKVNRSNIAIPFLGAAAVPIASNAYMLFAGSKLELQMASGLAMFIPLTLIMAFTCVQNKFFMRGVCSVICLVLIYGSAMQTWFDQEAMYEGQNACETIATQVISDLRDKNLLSTEHEYYFVGVPAKNPFFAVSTIYDCANAYAQMGNFWVSGNCSQMSYDGLIKGHMGFGLQMSFLPYEAIEEKTNVPEIPEFPENGYITLLDDSTVLIKISDYKTYTGQSKYSFD